MTSVVLGVIRYPTTPVPRVTQLEMAGKNEGRNEEISPALQSFVIDNIRIGNQIGRGAYGKILEAKWEGIVVAVKEIHSIFINEVSDKEFQLFKRNFLRECEQSSRLRHPNIVRFFGIYHPPDARVPSLVMERLHCSLTSLLENNPVVPIGTKTWIIKDVALGLRYLHTRNPPIIHRDLSSNNVLLSKGMEGKIGDLGTARLVDPRRQSRMTKAPGTVDFMPPEALGDITNIRYGKELDVFSFGCVMLHTLSHEWPTPSLPVITNPDTGLVTGGRSEVERRSEKIDRSRSSSGSDVLIPLIESCLSNLPKNRPSIVRVCDQLEGQLVDNERISSNELTVSALRQEIQRKDDDIQQKDVEIERKNIEIRKKDVDVQTKNTEIQQRDDEIHRNYSEIQQLTTALHDKDVMLETLRSEMAALKIMISPSVPQKISKQCSLSLMFQVNKSSSDFWDSLRSIWQQCANLPSKVFATSVAELNGKVYVTIRESKYSRVDPLMYDCNKDQWSILPALPYAYFSLVAVPDRKQLLAIGGMVINHNGVIETSNKVFLWDEENRKWTTPYPNMPTARCYCSSISHGSTVIVAGGLICWDPWTMTRAVEVLHIKEHGLFTRSHWSVVEQLPLVVCNPIPLIVNDKLYIALGHDKENRGTTGNIVTASLPELLQSSNKNTGRSQLWYKLPDMPYATYSINYYQERLITFGGGHRVEQPNADKPVYQSVPLIHIYNPCTHTWDHVGDIPYDYSLGRSVHISDNKILFIGGLTGTYRTDKDDNIVTTNLIFTLSP